MFSYEYIFVCKYITFFRSVRRQVAFKRFENTIEVNRIIVNGYSAVFVDVPRAILYAFWKVRWLRLWEFYYRVSSERSESFRLDLVISLSLAKCNNISCDFELHGCLKHSLEENNITE